MCHDRSSEVAQEWIIWELRLLFILYINRKLEMHSPRIDWRYKTKNVPVSHKLVFKEKINILCQHDLQSYFRSCYFGRTQVLIYQFLCYAGRRTHRTWIQAQRILGLFQSLVRRQKDMNDEWQVTNSEAVMLRKCLYSDYTSTVKHQLRLNSKAGKWIKLIVISKTLELLHHSYENLYSIWCSSDKYRLMFVCSHV